MLDPTEEKVDLHEPSAVAIRDMYKLFPGRLWKPHGKGPSL